MLFRKENKVLGVFDHDNYYSAIDGNLIDDSPDIRALMRNVSISKILIGVYS